MKSSSAVMVILGMIISEANAAEYMRQDQPHPATAEELETSIEHAFKKKPIKDRFLWTGAKEVLENKPSFWRDTKLDLDLRTYDFDRRNSDTDRAEATAQAVRLEYESGLWNNIGLRAAYYGSFDLDSPSGSGDTGLLAPGQENISTIAVANIRYEIEGSALNGSVVRVYRQLLNLPYINKNDIRNLPAAHEGYTLARKDSSLDYIVGHLTRFKNYDSNDFVDMSEAAGAANTSKGVSLAGVKYPVNDNFRIGAFDYYGHDTFNTFFTEATYHTQLSSGVDFRLNGQFSDQRSVGDDLVGDFDTHQFAGRAAFGWQGAVVKVGASKTDDGAGMSKPWGGSPSYLSIQRLDFDRANETAYLLGLSYNTDFFSSLGLSSFATVVWGSDAEDPATGLDLPDRTEYDITIDYRPPEGFLNGLWVRARANFIDIEGDGERVRDYRIIIKYDIPFL